MSPHLENNPDLQYLIQVIKGRKDPFIVTSAYCKLPALSNGLLHEIADLHDKLDYNDFVFLGQALAPGEYIDALKDLRTDAKWIGEGVYGDADDQVAIGNIQGFLKRAETWKRDDATKLVDTGSVLSDGYIMRFMASPDVDAERQAHHYSLMESSLDGHISEFKRQSYLKTIIEVTQYISSTAKDDSLSVRKWLKFMAMYRALEVTSILPTAGMFEMILGFSQDRSKTTQPRIRQEIHSLGIEYLESIARLDHSGMRQLMLTLALSNVSTLGKIYDQSLSLNVSDDLKARLNEVFFLSTTNGNFRQSSVGVSELIEKLKPELNWPLAIGKLDENGIKVLVANVKDRQSYLGLLPRKVRAETLEQDLGL